ncbi:MAG: glycosyltransferase family 2 protein [Sphingopyxis sp.]|nr:glycosyltransferase family 2 protein [Sphingopyxis sp.]
MAARRCIAVLAHNEEARIARCLASLLPLTEGDGLHVIVNGSSDATADIARSIAAGHDAVTVHDWPEGGKSRSWSRFVHEELDAVFPVHVFVDGDAEVMPGSLDALEAALLADPSANAAAGVPGNGRRARKYRTSIRLEHGLFGDLYALSGDFLDRMRKAAIRLPDDCIGDDGLIGALAKIDLGALADWRDDRVATAADARFLCEPVSLASPASWRLQYRRMINYSQRHFQNLLITGLLESGGAAALPRRFAPFYADALQGWQPRSGVAGWFDRRALDRMAKAAG